MTFKEYAFQDANTLEATQTMINTRVVTDFPLCDQEILLRHLHKTAGDYVNEYKKQEGKHEWKSQCQSFRLSSPTWSGSPTGACPPRRSATRSVSASTMAEMQEFYELHSADSRT